MNRTAEPTELMDNPAQAQAYAAADFGQANSLFIQLLEQQVNGALTGKALDLGCGPASIDLALIRQHAALNIDAVDGAAAMLDIARDDLQNQPQLATRLNLIQETLPSVELREAAYDFVISNSLLHHLADPLDLWLSLQYCAKQQATIVIMDLARPSSPLAVDSMVESYAMNEPDILREDFRNSLLAAYTVEEVQAQLDKSGLSNIEVRMVSDRHWAAVGRFNP